MMSSSDDRGPRRHSPHTEALIARAVELGITVEDLSGVWEADAVRFRRGEQAAVAVDGTRFPGLPHHAVLICDNKHATKAVLSELGVRVPRGIVVRQLDEQTRQRVRALLSGERFVAKPQDGTHGEFVALGLTSLQDVVSYSDGLPRPLPFILEEQIDGQDLRMHVVDGKIVAACVRVPGYITGDGHSTVAALIREKDQRVRALNSDNRLLLDDETQGMLVENGLTPASVLVAGRVLPVKRTNNISRGGEPVDVTDQLHPRWRAWCQAAAARLGMPFLAMDALTPEPAADPLRCGARVLEINGQPEWLHHTFSTPRAHDIAGLILERILQG